MSLSKPVIVLSKVSPRYRFICDDPTIRAPKKGDWILTRDDIGPPCDEFHEYVKPGHVVGHEVNDSADRKTMIFRREEVKDEN